MKDLFLSRAKAVSFMALPYATVKKQLDAGEIGADNNGKRQVTVMDVLRHFGSDHLWTVNQVAGLLSLHPSGIRKYCAEGRMGSKVGSSYVISSRDLEAFLADERKPGRKPKQ